MATYVNDLRLKEIATGDESGTWGTSTNTNLELIGEALSFGTEAITTNADTHTTTVADGASDPGRAMYLKYTGTLDSACTITIAPNTISRMQFIENGTSGSQNIIISQGSGANITIPPGDTKAVYLDGAGSGAAVVDAFASLSVVDLKVQDDLTVTDDVTISGDIDVDGTTNLDVVDIDGALTQDGGAVFNEDSADVDFRVESNGDANMFMVDGGNDRVGIGTGTPSFTLDLQKSLSESYSTSARPTALARVMNTNTADNNHATIEFGTEPSSGNGGVSFIGSTITGSNLADLFFGSRTGASSFATHMTIKSDGSVGIGETAPLATLHIKQGDSGLSSLNAAAHHLFLEDTGANGPGITLASGTTSNCSLVFGDSDSNYQGFVLYDNSADAMKFGTNGGSERMRITSSGNVGINSTATNAKLEVVATSGEIFRADANAGAFRLVANQDGVIMNGAIGIGTGSPAHNLHVVSSGNAELEVERTSGAAVLTQAQSALGVNGTSSNHDFGIITNGSVRARVHNDGGMSIGTADKLDTPGLLVFATHTNDNVGICSIRSQGDDESACALSIVKASATTSTSNILIRFGINNYNSGAGMITVSGATGAFGSFSDVRLKENIENLPSQLDNIMALRPVSFDYKEEEYGQKDQIGFVAQEVEEVYPDLVGENEGYKITSGINKMEARLIKAIQEQQEQIEQLKTQIETLQ